MKARVILGGKIRAGRKEQTVTTAATSYRAERTALLEKCWLLCLYLSPLIVETLLLDIQELQWFPNFTFKICESDLAMTEHEF